MVAAIGAVAGVAGAAISSSGAKSAAGQQAAASQEAQAMQMMAQAQMRQDLAPWTDSGKQSQALLGQYLGLGIGNGGVTSNGLATGMTPDQVRQQLRSQFTRTEHIDAPAPPSRAGQAAAPSRSGPGTAAGGANANPWAGTAHESLWALQARGDSTKLPQYAQMVWDPASDSMQYPLQTASGPTSREVVDDEGLNAAVQRYYDEQKALQDAAASDPRYGSLLRAYRDGQEFDMGDPFDAGDPFSFTGKDLENEPGYQFGLSQGELGIGRGQAARGNFLSGAAMKELNRFNQDYAGTKFNEGFNRSLTTHNTNLGNRFNEWNANLTSRLNEWNTNRSAYDDNRNRIYNFLSGQSAVGQNSAAQVGANNQQVANNVSNNMLASGNAAAAGTIAGSNAIASGINQAANAYMSTQNSQNPNSAAGWNSLLSGQGGGYSGHTGYVGQNDPLGGWIAGKGYSG